MDKSELNLNKTATKTGKEDEPFLYHPEFADLKRTWFPEGLFQSHGHQNWLPNHLEGQRLHQLAFAGSLPRLEYLLLPTYTANQRMNECPHVPFSSFGRSRSGPRTRSRSAHQPLVPTEPPGLVEGSLERHLHYLEGEQLDYYGFKFSRSTPRPEIQDVDLLTLLRPVGRTVKSQVQRSRHQVQTKV